MYTPILSDAPSSPAGSAAQVPLAVWTLPVSAQATVSQVRGSVIERVLSGFPGPALCTDPLLTNAVQDNGHDTSTGVAQQASSDRVVLATLSEAQTLDAFPTGRLLLLVRLPAVLRRTEESADGQDPLLLARAVGQAAGHGWQYLQHVVLLFHSTGPAAGRLAQRLGRNHVDVLVFHRQPALEASQ